MRKFKITIFLIISGLFIPLISQAGSLELTTYYPAPQGAYDRLVLMPQASLPTPCAIGSLIVEQSSGKLLYCHNIVGVGTWGPLSNVWTQSGTYLYPTSTDANPLIFASIGTSAPSFKLTLDNDGDILATGTFNSGVTTTYPSIAPNQTAPANARFIWYPRRAAFRAIWDRWGVTDDSLMGDYSIGFGDTPTVTGTASTASGLFNTITSDYGTIAGGKNNSVTGHYSTITGGQSNLASSQFSVVSGSSNQANGNYTTIGGGQNNISNGINETIGGGLNNTIQINSTYSTISGGELNRISKNYTVISGGYRNYIAKDYATISGGKDNATGANGIGIYSFIGGGATNTIDGDYAVIGGGQNNTNDGKWSTITGGHANRTLTGNYSTVLGGETNAAIGSSSVIAGGSYNTITNTGNYSTIAGGDHNTIAGSYSWAGGRYMNLSNTAHRTFVWGYSDSVINITAANAFILAPGLGSAPGIAYNPKLGINEPNPTGIVSITLPAAGGPDPLAITSGANAGDIFIVKNNGRVGIGKYNPNTHPLEFGAQANGAYLAADGTWTTPSSRTFKENIRPLNTQTAIETLQHLAPVTYNYKINPSEHHVGFIAEDVPEIIAEQNRNSVDPMNVTAVLTAVLKEQKKIIAQQEAILTNLENDVRNLKAELTNH